MTILRDILKNWNLFYKMLVALIINCLICFSYIFYVKLKHPQIDSISESYYYGSPFRLWCFLIGFTLTPIWLQISAEIFEFLAFLSCVFFVFLGTFPQYKEDQRIGHIICAGGLTILGLIWNCVLGHWSLVIPTVCIVLIQLLKKLDLYWIEVIGFISLYLGLFLSLV